MMNRVSFSVKACAVVALLGIKSDAANASAIGQTIAIRVDVQSYRHNLDDLLYTHTGMSRGVNGAQHDLCRDNIAAAFASYGLAVELHAFQYQGTTYHNVIATKTGTQFPSAYYIVSGHFDSVNNPGADDDASGVAAAMEIARVLSQFQTAYTIKFIAWDREEQGKVGSTAYVNTHPGDDIRGMVQLDMIAHDAGLNRQNLYSNAASAPLKNALIAAIGMYGNGLNVGDVGPASFSDHAPFNSAGYQAICFVEANYISNTCYHQPCDSVDGVNYIQYPFAANLARSVAGWLADAAQAYKVGDADGDGIVNVSDLLIVISAWGPCAAPPATCPADVNDDAQVDVNDLLIVVGNWG